MEQSECFFKNFWTEEDGSVTNYLTFCNEVVDSKWEGGEWVWEGLHDGAGNDDEVLIGGRERGEDLDQIVDGIFGGGKYTGGKEPVESLDDFYRLLGDAYEGIKDLLPEKSAASRGLSEGSMVSIAFGSYLLLKETFTFIR